MVLREREAAPRAAHFASSGPRWSRSFFPFLAAGVTTVAALSCENKRDDRSTGVAYDRQVQSLLERACLRCHAGVAPAGGWAADSYLGAIGCTASGQPVTVAAGAAPAPLLGVLDRSDHAGLVTSGERALLASWIASVRRADSTWRFSTILPLWVTTPAPLPSSNAAIRPRASSTACSLGAKAELAPST